MSYMSILLINPISSYVAWSGFIHGICAGNLIKSETKSKWESDKVSANDQKLQRCLLTESAFETHGTSEFDLYWDCWKLKPIAVAINHSKTTTCFLCGNAMTVITCFAEVFFTTQKHCLGMRLLWPVEQKQAGELKTQALRGHGTTTHETTS